MIDNETNSQPLVRLNLLDFDGTTEQTSSAGGDETDFLSRNSGARDGRGFSNMLVVSSSVRVVHRVHSHTTSTGPATPGILDFVARKQRKKKEKKRTCNASP